MLPKHETGRHQARPAAPPPPLIPAFPISELAVSAGRASAALRQGSLRVSPLPTAAHRLSSAVSGPSPHPASSVAYPASPIPRLPSPSHLRPSASIGGSNS